MTSEDDIKTILSGLGDGFTPSLPTSVGAATSAMPRQTESLITGDWSANCVIGLDADSRPGEPEVIRHVRSRGGADAGSQVAPPTLARGQAQGRRPPGRRPPKIRKDDSASS